MRASGQRVALAGPTGREPLVGLQLSIVEARRAGNAVLTENTFDALEALARSASKGADRQLDGAVRVFRPRSPNASVGEAATQSGNDIPAKVASNSKVRVFSREQLKVNKP